jgi:hypothetical protein
MRQHGLTEGNGARQKILAEILVEAGNRGPFDPVVGGQDSVASREQLHFVAAIDEAAQKVENMR